MISFRYHIVSIVAVFLALALGIVVGTTALNGPITKDLRRQVNSLKDQRTTLETQNKQLRNQVTDSNDFAAHYGAKLVTGTLDKQNVVLVSLPGADKALADGIATEIGVAGGKISGRLELTNSYIDPAQNNAIVSLATGAGHPADLTITPTSDPGVLGGELLAFIIAGKATPTDVTQVVSGFSGLHMVTTSDDKITPSSTVVLVGSQTRPSGDAGAGMELALVNALQKVDANIVVAGNAAAAKDDGIVSLVRHRASEAVSTVDNADTSMGQVATVLALADATKQKVGQYGTATGAQSLFP